MAPRLILARDAGVSAMTASCDLPVLEMGWVGPGEPGPLPPRVPAAEEPVYVIHTSGSTGRPKGVCMTRRGLGVFTRSLTRRTGCWPGMRVLQITSLSFDVAIIELCMAWGAGGSLVIPEPGPLVGEELRTALEHVDAALLTPSVLTTIDGSLTGVPVLVSTAEAMSADLVERFAPGRALFNAYGPTEAMIVTVAGPLSPSRGQEAPPIGRAIDAVRLVVLDDFLRPVPPGVPGELYIGGPGLAIGYLNRPGLTASRFVADPFRQSEVLYRTGDVVAWNRSWELTYLGRADSQLKVRGFRVEPGEIERCLADAPGVTGAVVIEAPDAPGRLVGYVTGDATPVHGSGGHHGAGLLPEDTERKTGPAGPPTGDGGAQPAGTRHCPGGSGVRGLRGGAGGGFGRPGGQFLPAGRSLTDRRPDRGATRRTGEAAAVARRLRGADGPHPGGPVGVGRRRQSPNQQPPRRHGGAPRPARRAGAGRPGRG